MDRQLADTIMCSAFLISGSIFSIGCAIVTAIYATQEGSNTSGGIQITITSALSILSFMGALYHSRKRGMKSR
jgi:hypothetical protein